MRRTAETSHQRTGQALDRRAVEANLKALRALLKWEQEQQQREAQDGRNYSGVKPINP